jgi:hypothetical protein
VRTARGAKKRLDGEKKALKRGAARFPVLVFAPPNPALLGWFSIVFAVSALQNLLFSIFVFVFLFGW